ncbi:MAG: hypothetical protein KDJ16_08890, partial [Hyphomicrobiales bacterium]|nr:hypothetical protein [Hyphomicrobiales bacterium]
MSETFRPKTGTGRIDTGPAGWVSEVALRWIGTNAGASGLAGFGVVTLMITSPEAAVRDDTTHGGGGRMPRHIAIIMDGN